jgi:hypothetical protein
MREDELIFIFSLPRSGSTLLQRLFCRATVVKSISEPALLLPLLYHRYNKEVYSSYNVQVFSRGVDDLVSLYRNGWDDYDSELRTFALRLYENALGGKGKYFVDKTPRYSLIAPEIAELFPRAKFIFLWRDPLRIVDSTIESLWSGRWLPSRMAIDLEQGVQKLCSAAEALGDRAMHIRYEELVAAPEEKFGLLLRKLKMAHLFEGVEQELPVRSGGLGDPESTSASKAVFQTSASRPLRHMGSFVRQRWILSRFREFPSEYWSYLGKSYSDMESELSQSPFEVKQLLADAGQSMFAWLDARFDFSVRKDRFKSKSRYVCR